MEFIIAADILSFKMPKVSVIIPNYNHAPYLKQRVESVLQQTYQDFELILLDDMSRDESANILQSYKTHPKVAHIIINEVNSGSTFIQWNRGIALARGKYLWLAESDDYASPDFLEKTVAVLENYPVVGLVYCGYVGVNMVEKKEVEEPRKILSTDLLAGDRLYLAKGGIAYNTNLLVSCPIPNASGVLFRKSLYQEIQNKLVDYKLCGDWLLWAHIISRHEYAYIDQYLNYYRYSTQTVRFNHKKIGNFQKEWASIIHILLSGLSVSTSNKIRIINNYLYHWLLSLWIDKIALSTPENKKIMHAMIQTSYLSIPLTGYNLLKLIFKKLSKTIRR
jgi:glycosyltransferase involved in cell wall biosynthesis